MDLIKIINARYYILIFILYRIAAGEGCGVEVKTNKDNCQKLFLMNQVSLYEFQI